MATAVYVAGSKQHKRSRKPPVSDTHRFVENNRVFLLHSDEIEEIADEVTEVATDSRFADKEPSAVVARRRNLSEATIDRCVAISRHAYKRGYHAQRTGMLNALSMSGGVLRQTLTEVA